MKSLTEIQQENRRMILKATHGCHSDYVANAIEKYTEYKGRLPLNRVLLALKQINFNEDNTGQVFEIRLFQKATKDEIDIKYDFLGLGFDDFLRWDLTKETLEEQSEETQRKVWELLTKE